MTQKISRHTLIRLQVAGLLLAVFAAVLWHFSSPFRVRDQVPEPWPAAAPDFAAIPAGQARKDAFLEFFYPLIQAENRAILQERQFLQALQDKPALSWLEEQRFRQLLEDYRVIDPDATLDLSSHAFKPNLEVLLPRVDVIPPSLALAQAAIESAWGTSRFAREGNNFFGHWCFKPGCGMEPAGNPNNGKYWVARFDDPAHSVSRYFFNLNTFSAYKPLRELRLQRRRNHQPLTGIALAPGLLNYSQKREEYVKTVIQVIQYNRLEERFPLTPAANDDKTDSPATSERTQEPAEGSVQQPPDHS